MQQINYGMMGYCPTQTTKKEPDPGFQFDLSVLIVVTIAAVISIVIIAYQRATGIFAYRRQQAERYKLKNGLVPGWVFRDKDSMTQWLKWHLGYEPKEYHVDMLMALRDARVNAFRRKNIGKLPDGFNVLKKITEEE